MKLIKKLLTYGCMLWCALSILAACNTMKGFGEDVERGGRAVSRSAEENKN